MNIAPSVAFPGFTVYTTGLVQLDSPELDGATNYDLLGNHGNLTIAFTVPQNSFSISLRDFKYLPGGAPAGGLEMVTVFGTDHTTVLSTYVVGLNKSIITSTDSSESAPIGAVNWSEISGEFWTGLLQSVTFSTPDPTPEPLVISVGYRRSGARWHGAAETHSVTNLSRSYNTSAKYYDGAYAVKADLVDLPFYVDLATKFGGPVLEIGCGTGRVLLPIARQGIEIHGVDNSLPMLGGPKKPLAAGIAGSSAERAPASRRHAPIPAAEKISPGDHAV
jgi:hypothetical protein